MCTAASHAFVELEESSLESLIDSIFGNLKEKALGVSMEDDLSKIFPPLEYFLSFQRLCSKFIDKIIIKETDGSDGAVLTGHSYENGGGFLGPFLSVGLLNFFRLPSRPNLIQQRLSTVMKDGEIVNPHFLNETIEALQNIHTSYIHSLHRIFLLLIKTNRKAIIDHFSLVILKLNSDKGKLQFDERKMSSYSLLFNVCCLWLKFSEPFSTPLKVTQQTHHM